MYPIITNLQTLNRPYVASEDLQKAFIAAPSTVVPLAKAYQDKKGQKFTTE